MTNSELNEILWQGCPKCGTNSEINQQQHLIHWEKVRDVLVIICAHCGYPIRAIDPIKKEKE